jgi:fatty-acyl-CoA synthase
MTPKPESSPLATALVERCQRQPDGLAVRFAQGNYDAAKFWRRVERVTGHLQQRLGTALARENSAQTGPRVAWLGLNDELQLAALFACARLGAVFMPLNFRLAVAELQTVLDQGQPALLVHDATCASTAQALGHAALPVVPQDDLIARPSPRDIPLPTTAHDTPVLLVHTSGTSGQPKGALHTQGGLLANAAASAWAHAYQADDHVLSALPLFHVGGLCIQTLPALLAGVPVTLHARFEPQAWLEAVGTGDITLSLLVPATLRAVIEHPAWQRTNLQGLRGVMTGSSTVPLGYLQAFHRRGIPVGQIYGSTETGPVSICLPFDKAISREGSAGWPAQGVEVRFVDGQGNPVPDGQVGEVGIRADNVMRGYWRANHPSGDSGLTEGWFHSGDLGQRAPDGCITIVGRSKDMIISGGENIYPAEIENLLATFPGVAECAVVGVDDPRWGEVPVATIVRTADPAGASLDDEQVSAYLAAHIARFKLPRRIVFVNALPKSALGKIQKASLRTVLETEQK